MSYMPGLNVIYLLALDLYQVMLEYIYIHQKSHKNKSNNNKRKQNINIKNQSQYEYEYKNHLPYHQTHIRNTMNIIIKSSIVALLAAAVSSVNADCIRDGSNAAELIISQDWCSSPYPRGIPASEEGCRELAIQTCQSEDTFRSIINEWGCKQPKTSYIRYLGDKCEDTVDHLIGITWPGLEKESSAFVATSKASKQPSNPTLEGREAGQKAIRDLWEGRRFRSNCRSRNVRNFKRQANTLIDSQFPENTGSSTTRAFNRAARRAAEREISTIESECSRPRPSPHPDGFVDGQNAMQQWYKDEGDTCANAWSGIINPAANEIKNSQFPMRGSRSTRAFNQNARAGIDHEVKAIQEKCFSANEMDMVEANEASFVGWASLPPCTKYLKCPGGTSCEMRSGARVGRCVVDVLRDRVA